MGTLPGLARTDLPSVRLERAGDGSLAGDARPGGDPALAGGGGRLPGDLLGGHSLRRSAGPAVPGLGMRRGRVRAQRGPRPGSDRGSCRGHVRLSPAGEGPDLGTVGRTTCSRRPATAILRRLGPPPRPGDAAPALERIALVPESAVLVRNHDGRRRARSSRWRSLALPLALAIVLARAGTARQPRESFVSAQAYGAGGPDRLARGHAGRGHVPGRTDGRAVVLRRRSPWGWPRSVSPRGRLALVVIRPDSFCCSRRWVWARLSLSTGRRRSAASPRSRPSRGEFARLIWTESLPLLRDFPLVGTGLGSFGTIYPYVKTHDASLTTAMSSLLQCGVESGAVGLGILGMAALWCFCPAAGMLQTSRPGRPHARLRLDRGGPGI